MMDDRITSGDWADLEEMDFICEASIVFSACCYHCQMISACGHPEGSGRVVVSMLLVMLVGCLAHLLINEGLTATDALQQL